MFNKISIIRDLSGQIRTIYDGLYTSQWNEGMAKLRVTTDKEIKEKVDVNLSILHKYNFPKENKNIITPQGSKIDTMHWFMDGSDTSVYIRYNYIKNASFRFKGRLKNGKLID